MDFIDLTHCRVVTPHGTPIVHADGGAWGWATLSSEALGILWWMTPAPISTSSMATIASRSRGLSGPTALRGSCSDRSTAILDTGV